MHQNGRVECADFVFYIITFQKSESQRASAISTTAAGNHVALTEMGSVGEELPTEHKIVVLEGQFCPIPSFSLPKPHSYTIEVHQKTTLDEIPSRIRHANIILTTTLRITAENLSPQCCPDLRLICVMASGTDSIDLEACRQRGIRVVRASEANVAVR